MVRVAVAAHAEHELRQMYDEHATAVFRFVLRLNGSDRGGAEDVVQDTFVRAWQHRAALLDHGASIRPWLFTVARRLLIDQHRRRSARPDEIGGEASERTLQAVAGDDDEIEAGLNRIVVGEALSSLSRDHQDVLLQTYFAQRTVNEAAAALGVPSGTVKSRTHYAMQALRIALTERGVQL
jgi:RNA polymerase sigma-70 factor, ECF subfamily